MQNWTPLVDKNGDTLDKCIYVTTNFKCQSTLNLYLCQIASRPRTHFEILLEIIEAFYVEDILVPTLNIWYQVSIFTPNTNGHKMRTKVSLPIPQTTPPDTTIIAITFSNHFEGNNTR